MKRPLQIDRVSISNKRRIRVVFVKDGKVTNSNTVHFMNRYAANRFLENPLSVMFG